MASCLITAACHVVSQSMRPWYVSSPFSKLVRELGMNSTAIVGTSCFPLPILQSMMVGIAVNAPVILLRAFGMMTELAANGPASPVSISLHRAWTTTVSPSTCPTTARAAVSGTGTATTTTTTQNAVCHVPCINFAQDLVSHSTYTCWVVHLATQPFCRYTFISP